MNENLSYYDIYEDRFFEVARVCEANVKAIRRRLGYFNGRFLRDLLKTLRRYGGTRNRGNAQDVYRERQHARQHLANMLEEKRITG